MKCPSCGGVLEPEPVAGAEALFVCRACGAPLALKNGGYERLTLRDIGRLPRAARNHVSLIAMAHRLKEKLN